MKKLILSYLIIAVTLLVACEPIEVRDSVSGNVTAEALALKVLPVVVDGKNSNEIIVENNSPILSRWISDRNQIQSSYCTVICDTVGTRNIKFVGRNGDGTTVEKIIPVKVDTLTNLTASTIDRLGIKMKADGTVDKTSLPYYWGYKNYTYTVSVIQEKTIDGLMKGNKVTVVTNAPYLCDWTFGDAKGNKNSCELFVTSTGTFTLSLNFTKSDGTVIKNAFKQDFVVENLTTVPAEYTNLFGDFVADPMVTRTWQWARSGKVWANGPLRGFTDPSSGWWQNAYADMSGRQDGTMTFKFADLSLTKVVTGGDAAINAVGTYKGKIEVDLGSKTAGYSVGTIKLTGVSILYGVDVNAANAPFKQVSLVKVTANTLILGGDSDGTGQTWLYKFERVN